MIPNFPKFKKLMLTDKEQIERITSKFAAYSDYNFVSLWSYNIEDDINLSILNNNLVIRFRDYLTNEKFYSFIGKNNIIHTIDTLLKLSEKEGLPPILKLIPEESVLIKNLKEYNIEEDRDNHDYILSATEHTGLVTSKYYKHRKLVKKFFRENPFSQIKILDLGNQNTADEILELFKLWTVKTNKNIEDTEHELIALKRTLKNYSSLNLLSLGLYNKDKFIGFIIADKNHHAYIESHFLKYLPGFNGLNHLFHHVLAKYSNADGVNFINIEQDLGIDGLRRAKESAKPIKYLKKYSIAKKSFN